MAWLSTLTRDDGTNPPKTITLSGRVGDNTAVLSFATLKQLAKFDSKGDRFYNYVNENDYWVHPYQLAAEHVMLAALFDEKKGCDLKRDNLKPIVRVLLQFLIFNIAPRLGDKTAVRKWEVPVLYAIMTGQLKLSFCQLVIMHVWQARNAKGKKLIPHARLLSALLEKQGALKEDEVPLRKPHTIFSLSELASTTWVYKKTKKWHKLKMGPGERVKVLQWGKQPLAPGEMDDQDSSDEELMRRKREAGLVSGEGPSEPQPGEPGYSWGVFDDETQVRVTSMRPPEYNDFEQFQRCLFDHTSRIDVTRTREHEEMMAHHREAERIRHIDSQMELNMRAYDENQYRRHLDYYNGVPYVENPPYVDYSALEPYQPGMPRHPSPQVHGSMWLPQEYTEPHYQSSYPYQPPPYEYQQQQQDEQGAGGIFDMSSFYEHLGGYYGGPPGPSYR